MKKLILILVVFFMCPALRAQWRTATARHLIIAFGVHDSSLFASCHDAFTDNYLQRYTGSSDPFNRWVMSDTGIDFSQGRVTSFASLGQYFFAGMTASNNGPGTAWRSSDEGRHWTANAGGFVCTNGRYMYCVADGIYRSLDSGGSWHKVNNTQAELLSSRDSIVFAFRYDARVRSTDSGSTWSNVSMPLSNVKSAIWLKGMFFIANNSDTIAETKNNGNSWVTITIPRRIVTQLASNDKYIFAGTDSGVYLSRDSGATWTVENDGLGTIYQVNALCVCDTLLFVNTGTQDYYTAFRPLSDFDKPSTVTPIDQQKELIAIYPNPTRSSFTIECSSEIRSVQVLNALGEEDLTATSATTRMTLDISSLPSGLYWCRVRTANSEQVQKLIIES